MSWLRLDLEHPQLDIPLGKICWALREYPLDFASQLEPSKPYPIEQGGRAPLDNTLVGCQRGTSLLERAPVSTEAVVCQNMTPSPADTGATLSAGAAAIAVTRQEEPVVARRDAIANHASSRVALDTTCIELFGESFYASNDGGGSSAIATTTMTTTGDAQREVGRLVNAASSSSIVADVSCDFEEPDDDAPWMLPREPATEPPLREFKQSSAGRSPGASRPVSMASGKRITAIPAPSGPGARSLEARRSPSPGTSTLGLAAAARPTAPSAVPPAASRLRTASLGATGHSLSSNGELQLLGSVVGTHDADFCDAALRPLEGSFERASWVASLYRNGIATAAFVLHARPPQPPPAISLQHHASPGGASGVNPWTLSAANSGARGSGSRLIPPPAAPLMPKPRFVDHAIATLAPLVGRNSSCTNVGASVGSLRAFLSQLTACGRMGERGARRHDPLPNGFPVVSWDTASSAVPPPLLSWCLVGDKLRPEYSIAVVFSLLRPRVVAGGEGSDTQGPPSQTFFSLPLVPSALVAAAASESGAPVRALYTSPVVPFAEVPDAFDLSSSGVLLPRESTLASAGGAASSSDVPLSRRDRWRGFAAALATPGLRKVVWDPKGSLYALLRCPITAGTVVTGLCDPCVAAWLLTPDDFGKAVVKPPPWALPVLRKLHGGEGSRAASVSPAPEGEPLAEGGGDVGDVSLATIAAAYGVASDPSQLRVEGGHPAFAHLTLLGRTFASLEALIVRSGMAGALHGIESPLLSGVAAIEAGGIAFDALELRSAEASVRDRLSELEAEAATFAGVPFLLTSPQQVASVLYDRLGLLPPRARSDSHGKHAPRKGEKRHASVDDAALTALAASNQHPLPEIIRSHRKLFKLLSAGILSLANLAVSPWGGGSASESPEDGSDFSGSKRARQQPPQSSFSARFPSPKDDLLHGDDDGASLGADTLSPRPLWRLHTRLHTTATGTGRLSSSDPNLQNLPTDVAVGRVTALLAKDGRNPEGQGSASEGSHNVRAAIRPRQAGWVLVSIDLQQIEMRVLAHMCRDPLLLSVFRCAGDGGTDIYCSMAAHVHRISPAEVSPDQRRQAKTVVLGLCYGLGVVELAAKLGVTEAAAGSIRTAFMSTYPGVRTWISAAQAYGRRHGFVPTLTGRLRPLPGFSSTDQREVALCERQAVNSVVQGTAADLIKAAMVSLDFVLRSRRGPGAALASAAPRMLLQVHDELLFESPPGATLEALVALATDTMTVHAPQWVERLCPFFRAEQSCEDASAPPWMSEAAALLGGSAALQVPLGVTVEVGPDWGNMKPLLPVRASSGVGPGRRAAPGGNDPIQVDA